MTAYIGVGGNERNSLEAFQELISLLKLNRNLQITGISSLYRSKAWGKEDQADFYNCVISLDTKLDAHQLLDYALMLEEKLGRNRKEAVKWGPRLIDIDILLYADSIIHSSKLDIPHPFILKREFVYIPLLELNENIEIPEKGTLKDLVEPSHHMDIIDIQLYEA